MTNSDQTKNRRPPRHLSEEAKGWWRRLTAEFVIDDEAGLLTLQSTLEALDRLRGAQAILAQEGITVADRFGQPKQHPATMVERDARTALMRGLKALNLDVVMPGPIGRPGGS